MKDHEQECFRCRVPNGCNTRDSRCGIRRGVKYGIYPKSVFRSPALNYVKIEKEGVKEKPLFPRGFGMHAFCEAVARYTEPFIERDAKFNDI